MVVDSPGGPEVVGILYRRSGQVVRPFRRSRSGRKTLPEVRKELGYSIGGPDRSWDPPEGPEVVRTLPRRSRSGRETLPEVRKWSETIPEV